MTYLCRFFGCFTSIINEESNFEFKLILKQKIAELTCLILKKIIVDDAGNSVEEIEQDAFGDFIDSFSLISRGMYF